MLVMSGKEKCRMYKETQSSIKKLLEKGLKLDRNIYMNQIVLIKKDVTSNDENVRKTALEMLNFLLRLNVEEIEIELIKVLHDNAVNKFIQNCILKSIKQKVVDTISENKYNFTNILSAWKDQNTTKLTNIIEDVCVSDLPKDKCKEFFINTIIPTMMTINTNNQIRDALIDIAFMMSTILSISDLSAEELETFLKNVNTVYVINIGDLRDKDYPNWHNLWIFLVRFCDKHIHYSMDLTNRLLRVVEFAFRNSSVQQRLKGYDCWKELIDNASLDMNHMCSAKQIKLLITPLKAKFSKQEVVICKRFDMFTYLLEKLQHKAVLCLTEFFEFCFGPVGNKDINKIGQGKSVPQIWTKSTKVLIEIIGHSHGKTVPCLSTEEIIKLEKPVINYTNMSNFYKVIINSVGECCTLLKEVDIQSKRETVIKCVWKSIFNLTIPTSEGNRRKYFQLIAEVLDKYLAQSRENPYFEDLLILIFTVLMSYDEEFVYEIIEYILKQLITILFTVDDFPLSVADKFNAVIAHWFTKIFMPDNKLKVLKEIMTLFTKLTPIKENVSYAGKLWLYLSNELVSVSTTEQIEQFSDFNNFFMWPAYYMHLADEVTKKQVVLHWMKLYRKITTDAENKKLNVMKDLQKVFKSNPLLNPNVVSLLNIMSQFETKFGKEFVNNMMIVSSQILQLPNLKTEEEQKITALIMQHFEASLDCFAGDISDELIKNICTCIEHILCIHKAYKVLDALTTFMKNSPSNLRSKFSIYLSTLLLDLFNKESDTNSSNAKELQKALQVLNIENVNKTDSASPFVPPTGRSARIAHMAKSSPKSPKKRGKNVEPSPTALRLFGKDVDTLTPLPVKGSQLNIATPRSKKILSTLKSTPRNVPSINDEKSSDFVPIDTEVKFQPEKLNKHQKEVMRKRREDIPALYQDLSQSLSQDIFSSPSSSKSFDKTEQTSLANKKKVIVEVIGDQFNSDSFPVEEKCEVPFHATPEAKSVVQSMNVPNLFSDAALSSEIIPEAPIQTIEDLIPNTDLSFEANLFPDAMLPSEITSDEAVQVKELTVPSEEVNTEESMNLRQVGSHKTLDPEETMIQEEKEIISENSEIESKSKNIVAELEHKEKLISQKSEVHVEKEPYQIEVVVEGKESAKSEAEEKEKRRKQKIELELQKLRMDIVGAEEFLAASRRTRTREKPKKLDDISSKKNKTPAKEEKQSPQRQQTSRKSFNIEISESKEFILEKNRRKTISTIQDAKHVDISRISAFEDKFNKSKDFETPKTRKKRSGKYKLDDNKIKSNVTSPKQENLKNIFGKDETIQVEKGQKRKRGSGDEESEDIIESSQEFQVLTPVFNVSKRKSLIDTSCIEQKLDKSEEKTLVQQKTVTKEDFLPVMEQHLNKVGESEIHTEEGNKPTESNVLGLVTQESSEINHDDVNIKQIEKKLNEVEEGQTETNTSQDTTVTQDSTQDLTQEGSQGEDADVEQSNTQDTQTQSTQTQETATQSEFSTVSEDTHPPVLYFDLPKKPELTESERMMCRMDTMSICMDPKNLPLKFNSDDHFVEGFELSKDQKLSMDMEDVLDTPSSKTSSNLPSSPVTVETPNRTSELLNNTLDISPINSKCSSDDGDPEENRNAISINFKAEMDELDKMEKEKILELILERNTQKVQEDQNIGNKEKQLENFNENGEIPILFGDILKDLGEVPNQLETALQQNEEIPLKIEISYQTAQNLVQCDTVSSKDFNYQQKENTPHEIQDAPLQIEETQHQPEEVVCQPEEISHKKLDMPDIGNTKPIKDTSIQERASRLVNMVNVNSTMTHRMFIKKRSVTMSPSTARIKKLMSNLNHKPNTEEITGDLKEEDLLTFSREVPSPMAVPRSSILKRKISDSSDSDGISPCPKRKRVNFSDPCLTSKKLFIKDEYNHEAETSSVFDDTAESKTEEKQAYDILNSSDESLQSEKMSETENFETERSLELVNPFMLKKDKPIYPKLVDCKENVILILKRVTSPMFITTLMNKLKSKEIKTIGDLAKQSEAEINRFPFKVPVVPNVYKVLDSYYNKNIDKFVKDGSDNGETSKVNGMEENKRQGVIKKTSPRRVDSKVEFRQLIEKSKTEGTLEDFIKILLSSVEKQQLLDLFRAHYKLEINDFLPETDFKLALKYISQKIGLPNILEMLTSSLENAEEESVYFDCIMKQSLEKRSLSSIWENHSLEDIRSGLEESISKNIFNRQDVIDKCLFPLIKSPKDISSYLNQISVVQLGDIVVERLKNSDSVKFFHEILKSCGREYNVILRKEILVRFESPNEMVSIFQDCIDAQSEENQSEIMVEMFKYISGKLNVNTLLQLHVDFLKRIPSLLVSSEK